MRSVAAIPALGLLAGSALGLARSDLPVSFLVLVFAVAGVAAVASWRRVPRVSVALVVVSCAALGALRAERAWLKAWRPPLRVAFDALGAAERRDASADHRFVPVDDEAFAVLSGVLRADAGQGQNGVSLSIDVDDPAEGGVLATVVGALGAERMGEWRAGRRVRVPVQLRRPSRYLDPGVADNERALARRGTTLVGTVKSAALVEVLARGSPWAEALATIRAFSRQAIAASVGRWSPRSAAIVNAIVIGDRAGLDDDVQRALQEAGTYHVIAISGGNIAILTGLLLAAFRLAGLLGPVAMVCAVGLLAAYAALVGGGASVDRATLMAAIFLAGRAVDQRGPPLNALWLTAGLLAVADPLSVADPAFILTFGATFAILLAAPVAARRMRAWPAAARTLGSMLVASFAAEALLFPVGAFVFLRVTFAGLALNFLAIPLMAVAQVAGMVVVPAALATPRLALVPGFAAHVGAAGLVWSAGLVAYAPSVTYRVAPPGWSALIGYYLALVALWRVWPRMRLRRVAAVAVAAAAVWMLAEPWAWWAARGDGRLHVTFLDVGQGDSAFVRFPHGHTIVVDTGGLTFGGGFDVGDRVVAPVLRAAGVRRLDYLALTHGDPDHIGGAPSLLAEFRPREVWEGIPVPQFAPLTRLRTEARALGSRWANVYAGDRLVVDGVEVRAKSPPPAEWERPRVRNDDSLVLELRWRDVSVLLTGDMGKAVERTLLGDVPTAPIRVLKVPHHGSLTSSSREWVDALRPTLAIVSVGRDNHFGHPAPEVLERYAEIGTRLFRTDLDGAVMIDTDGTTVSARTSTGKNYETGSTRAEMQPRRHEGTK